MGTMPGVADGEGDGFVVSFGSAVFVDVFGACGAVAPHRHGGCVEFNRHRRHSRWLGESLRV